MPSASSSRTTSLVVWLKLGPAVTGITVGCSPGWVVSPSVCWLLSLMPSPLLSNTTVPWFTICVTPAGNGSSTCTRNVMITCPRPGTLMSVISSVGVSLNTVLPGGAVTLPATYVVFAGMSSMNVAPLTPNPVGFRITTVYSNTSPGSTFSPFSSVTLFVEVSSGVTVSGVMVASVSPGTTGSSVTTSASWLLDTVPWLETELTPAGKGSLMVTWKEIVTELPPGIVPTSTLTLVSVAPLPLVTVPRLVWMVPVTRVVNASGMSLKITPVASWLPLLMIVTWYSSVSPGLPPPSPSASTNSTSDLLADRSGDAVTSVTVGSVVPPSAGSSVGSVGSSLLETVPWL